MSTFYRVLSGALFKILDAENHHQREEKVNYTAKYIIFNLRDHIFKENYILYPTAIESIKEKEIWKDMKRRCYKIGYCGFTPKV